jgi:hypothetical protein
MVSELDCAFHRGRIPAHLLRDVFKIRLILHLNKASGSRHWYHMLELVFFFQQSSGTIAANIYNNMICCHFMTYGKFSRPFVYYELPKVVTPDNFSKYMYYQMTGFWPEQITEISNELSLIPAAIKCRRTGCYAVEVAPIRS